MKTVLRSMKRRLTSRGSSLGVGLGAGGWRGGSIRVGGGNAGRVGSVSPCRAPVPPGAVTEPDDGAIGWRIRRFGAGRLAILTSCARMYIGLCTGCRLPGLSAR